MEAASELGLDVLHHHVGTWSNSGPYLTTKLRTEDSTGPPGASQAVGLEGVKCGGGDGKKHCQYSSEVSSESYPDCCCCWGGARCTGHWRLEPMLGN